MYHFTIRLLYCWWDWDWWWVVCFTAPILLSFFFFSSRRRHTRFDCDWSSDVCSSDLGILALFAERVRPTPRPLPDGAAQLLDAVLTRRRQLLEMLTAEKNRLGFAPKPLHRGIQAHIRWLERQLDDVTKELAGLIEASPVWRAKDDLLQSVPGVGPIVSSTLLGELPRSEEHTSELQSQSNLVCRLLL